MSDEGEYNYPKALRSDRDPSLEIDINFDQQKEPLNEECQICLDETFDPKTSIVLPCRHQSCAKCIMEWQKGNRVKPEGISLEGDKCPTCREQMPVVEGSLLERANRLYRQAKQMGRENQSEQNQEKRRQNSQQHQKVCEDALHLFDMVLLYKGCQRYTPVYRATLLTEMGRCQEAADEINKCIANYYSVTDNPIVLNCAKYEEALKEGNKQRQQDLFGTMTQQLQLMRMHPGGLPSFLFVFHAYTDLVRAYTAGKEWEKAIEVIDEKLMDFTWLLQAETPWIADGSGPMGFTLHQRNLEFMLNKGICLYNLGKYENAIAPLSVAVLANRQCKVAVDPYRYLALTFQMLGDWEEMLKVITMAAMYQPHCQIFGEDVCAFYKEMLKDWYDNHRQDAMPTYQTRKLNLLQSDYF